jgi:hypothetical protein
MAKKGKKASAYPDREVLEMFVEAAERAVRLDVRGPG